MHFALNQDEGKSQDSVYEFGPKRLFIFSAKTWSSFPRKFMKLASSVPYESSNVTGGNVIELASEAACEARSRVPAGTRSSEAYDVWESVSDISDPESFSGIMSKCLIRVNLK